MRSKVTSKIIIGDIALIYTTKFSQDTFKHSVWRDNCRGIAFKYHQILTVYKRMPISEEDSMRYIVLMHCQILRTHVSLANITEWKIRFVIY